MVLTFQDNFLCRVFMKVEGQPEVDVSFEDLFPVCSGPHVGLDQLVRVQDEGRHPDIDVELGQVVFLHLDGEMLVVTLPLEQ